MGMTRREQKAGRYDRVFKTFHWLIAALVSAQFVIAWTMPDLPRGAPPSGLVSLHLTVGVTILFFMLLRLLWRMTHAVPEPPRDIPR
jgi:cytochrome b561